MRRLILATAACLLGPPASAQTPTYAYRWSSDGGATLLLPNAPVSYGAPNSTVSLRLFVTQTGGSPATLLNPGLFSAGTRVTFTNPTNGAAVVGTASVAGNTAGFNDASAYFRDVGAGFADLSLATNNPFVGVSSATAGVYVGDFTFTVQGTGTATTTVTAFSPTDINSNHLYPTLLAGSGTDISSLLGTATVVFVPVPEPAGLLAVAGLVAVAARRLRSPR